MIPSNPIDERNQEVARAINDEARRNPRSPYAGKWVGIANGQVVAVSDDPEEMHRLMRQTGVDPDDTLYFQAGANVTEAEEIWSLF